MQVHRAAWLRRLAIAGIVLARRGCQHLARGFVPDRPASRGGSHLVGGLQAAGHAVGVATQERRTEGKLHSVAVIEQSLRCWWLRRRQGGHDRLAAGVVGRPAAAA